MNLDKINEAIATSKVFFGKVTKIGREKTEDGVKDYMTTRIESNDDLNGSVCRIYMEESDDEMDRRSLLPLLDSEIPFILIGNDVEHNVLIGSRKQAQRILKERLIARASNGQVLDAKIVKMMNFGAFVEVDGVSGILRTTDFSTDHSEVDEYYKVGDTVKVLCRDISEDGRLSFKAETLHTRKQLLVYDVQEDQICVGVVRSIRNFEKGHVAFVRIATGLDCLCSMPTEMEVERDARVAVHITSVREREDDHQLNVRGRIVRVY